MKKLLLIAALLLFAGIIFGQTSKKSVTVGTFDSRVIAVAYYNTEAHQSYIEDLKTEHAEAEASGDMERVKELEASLQLGASVLHQTGLPTDEIEDLLQDFRSEYYDQVKAKLDNADAPNPNHSQSGH